MMRLWVMVLALAALSTAAMGHAPTPQEYRCGLCNTAFIDFGIGTYSTSGSGPELRIMSYIGAGQYTFLTCPACFYTSGGKGFLRTGEKARVKVARPEAVREALAKVDKEAIRQPGPMVLEQIRLALICHQAGGKPIREIRDVRLLGAWAADDAGEDALAALYRRQVIAMTDAVLKTAGAEEYVYPWVVRFQRAALRQTLGQRDQAFQEFVEIDRGMEQAIRTLAGRLRKKRKPKPEPPQASTIVDGMQVDLERLLELRERARVAHLRATFRKIGQVAALARARKGDRAERVALLDVYAARPTPETLSFLRQLLPPAKGDEKDWATRDCTDDQEAYLNAVYRAHGEPCKWWPFLAAYEPGKALDRHAKALRSPERLKVLSDTLDRLADWDVPPVEAVFLTRPWFPQPLTKKQEEREFPAEEPAAAYRAVSKAVGQLCYRDDLPSAKLLLADRRRRPNFYLAGTVGIWSGGWWSVDVRPPYDPAGLGRGPYDPPVSAQVAAKLGPQATTEADRQLRRLETKADSLAHVLVALAPLEYLQDEKSRRVLLRAAQSKHNPVRLRAGRALLARGDPIGKDVLLAESARHGKPAELWIDDCHELLSLVGPSDEKRLRALLNPAKPEEWVLACLAKIGAPSAVTEYEAFARKTDARVGKVWQDFGSYRTTHTPASVQHVVAYGALGVADTYCTPALADFLLAESRRQPDPDGHFVNTLIRALSNRPALHGRCRSLCADLARRPVCMHTKLQLLETMREVKLPEVETAARVWSQSKRNRYLAEQARKALAASGK